MRITIPHGACLMVSLPRDITLVFLTGGDESSVLKRYHNIEASDETVDVFPVDGVEKLEDDDWGTHSSDLKLANTWML